MSKKHTDQIYMTCSYLYSKKVFSVQTIEEVTKPRSYNNFFYRDLAFVTTWTRIAPHED
jgi:hypothetical protein